jgi:hypothetical protein
MQKSRILKGHAETILKHVTEKIELTNDERDYFLSLLQSRSFALRIDRWSILAAMGTGLD